jgi:hypothetical protein
MVQAKLSENLHPKHWKRERALASKGTTPSFIPSENTFQVLETLEDGKPPLSNHTETVHPLQMPCPQSTGGLSPLTAGNKLEGYEPRFFLKEDGK